jgi:hypothetical protein
VGTCERLPDHSDFLRPFTFRHRPHLAIGRCSQVRGLPTNRHRGPRDSAILPRPQAIRPRTSQPAEYWVPIWLRARPSQRVWRNSWACGRDVQFLSRADNPDNGNQERSFGHVIWPRPNSVWSRRRQCLRGTAGAELRQSVGAEPGRQLPLVAQPASSSQFRDTTAPRSARPIIGWNETFPTAYRSLGLSDVPSLGNSGGGRDPEAANLWLPGDVAPGKLGAYRDVGDPYPSNGTVDRFTDGPPNLSGAISDAPEDSWIPDARYVQARGRRGGGRPGEPELSTAETVRFTIYNHNRTVLRELDPQNPLITTHI